MSATARSVGQIAKRLVMPIAACAPSRAAEKVGIVFLHGEAGAPDRVILGLIGVVEKAGYLVSRPDMCWSAG